MIDGFAQKFSAIKNKKFDSSYRPEQAVTGSQIINPDSAFLAVLLPPWHGGGVAYSTLAQRLARSGSAVVDYSFHDQILETNVTRVLKSFLHIGDIVSQDLDQLSRNYDSVKFIAASLDNVALGVIVNQFRNFDSATMLVAGSSLARATWEGNRTQDIKMWFDDHGLKVEELVEAWSEIEPANNASAFSGKAVDLYVSNRDGIIPSYQQHEMAEALLTAGAEVTTRVSTSGHYWTVGRYCFFEKL